MTTPFSFLAGLLFGLGLIISGMSNPAKVLGFLDLAGLWDPSLIGVMGGAVAVGLLGFRIGRQRGTTLLGNKISWPTATRVDRPLLVGSALFGIGWGLGGYCPGPAIAGLGLGNDELVWFLPAMLAGGWLRQRIAPRR